MKQIKKLTALLLALTLVLSLAACGITPDPTDPPKDPTSTPTNAPTDPAPTDPAPTDPVVEENKWVVGEAKQPDAAGTPAKWTETKTADGWVEVINEGGETLGYDPDSGVTIIQVDGYAFKDLDQDGELDVYEDWRVSNEERAIDLVCHMTGYELAPLFCHSNGWGTFTTEGITSDNSIYAVLEAGVRGGVTRSAGSNVSGNTDHAIWSNDLQALCEGWPYGIPALISLDPNGQSGLISSLALASTMDTDLAYQIGLEISKQYRNMGVHVLLGPQVDLVTSPVMDRASGTFGEDPALSAAMAEAFVSGLQSTVIDGIDTGYGYDSIVACMKHYAGAGAVEGGADDHNNEYSVFPNNNYEAHLIPFHDGAFSLVRSSTGEAGAIMMNYSMSVSKDGSLGEMVAGAYSSFKTAQLDYAGWQGVIFTDWEVTEDGTREWGMEEATVPERFAALIKNGIDQVGGSTNYQAVQEAYDILVGEMGEEAALQLFREAIASTMLLRMNLNLFENPYCSTATVAEENWSSSLDEFSAAAKQATVVMLKNDGTVKQAAAGQKLTVYVPYKFTAASSNSSGGSTPASWSPAISLDLLTPYFNVITDTVGEPTGAPAEEGGEATYTENDIIRASAEDLAKCDIALVSMTAPKTSRGSSTVENADGTTTTIYTPPSLQYGEYTATTARETSLAGDKVEVFVFDPYGGTTRIETENRSYKDQTAPKSSSYSQLEMLQWVEANVPESCSVVVMMTVSGGAMCWHEVEPLSDVILYCNSSNTEQMLKVAAGLAEPTGLLCVEQPKNMEAVEAQAEDTPRDMECYVDANGNTYAFCFGLNWSGVINDERTAKFNVPVQLECTSFEFQYAD